jgi:hypothetical protein
LRETTTENPEELPTTVQQSTATPSLEATFGILNLLDSLRETTTENPEELPTTVQQSTATPSLEATFGILNLLDSLRETTTENPEGLPRKVQQSTATPSLEATIGKNTEKIQKSLSNKVAPKEKDEGNHIQALVQNNFKNVLKFLHIKVALGRIIPGENTKKIQESLSNKVAPKEKDEGNHIQALVQNNFKNVLKFLHIKVALGSK